MSTNKTQHYQLNQWEAEDKVLRTEFNEDNQKIDQALQKKADQEALTALQSLVSQKADSTDLEEMRSNLVQIAAGAYTGDGAASRLISLPFSPKAVYLCDKQGRTYASGANLAAYYYGGLAVTGNPATAGGTALVTLEAGGFRVVHKSSNGNYYASNEKNTVFHYLALG